MPHVLLQHAHHAQPAFHRPLLLGQVALAARVGVVIAVDPKVLRTIELDDDLEAARERQVEVEVGLATRTNHRLGASVLWGDDHSRGWREALLQPSQQLKLRLTAAMDAPPATSQMADCGRHSVLVAHITTQVQLRRIG